MVLLGSQCKEPLEPSGHVWGTPGLYSLTQSVQCQELSWVRQKEHTSVPSMHFIKYHHIFFPLSLQSMNCFLIASVLNKTSIHSGFPGNLVCYCNSCGHYNFDMFPAFAVLQISFVVTIEYFLCSVWIRTHIWRVKIASILRLPSTWLQIKVEVSTTPYYTILHDCAVPRKQWLMWLRNCFQGNLCINCQKDGRDTSQIESEKPIPRRKQLENTLVTLPGVRGEQ